MEKVNEYYEQIILLENLLSAWQEFVVGKRNRLDVQIFERDLMANIISLNADLEAGKYKHSAYQPFKVSDPKPRNIHKAAVRDRLLHKAIYRVLYPVWDKTFIFDSYSCRDEKGTHKAFGRLQEITRKISRNYTQPCFALKCDIRKFFDSVDHQVLFSLLSQKIQDQKLMDLFRIIIGSFETVPGKGMPLGNLTSQLFANIYMNPLDQFAKHQLKAKHYLRYADDFIFVSDNPEELMGYLVEVNQFVKAELKLTLHPNKISLRKLKWGIDFVGYVDLPKYSIPRSKTVKRMKKRINKLLELQSREELSKTMPSYLGHLSHAWSYGIRSGLESLVESELDPAS